jgi:hypothetical protein
VVNVAVRPLIVLALLLTASLACSQQPPSRLVVSNNSGATVELFTAVNQAWQSRGRISPKASLPVYNVVNGQRFRAVWGSQSREHTVQLTYDRSYNGWQDTFALR